MKRKPTFYPAGYDLSFGEAWEFINESDLFSNNGQPVRIPRPTFSYWVANGKIRHVVLPTNNRRFFKKSELIEDLQAITG